MLTTALTASVFAGHSAFAASATYTGGAGDGLFDSAGNWNPAAAPGDTTVGVTTNTDTATFAQATGSLVSLSTQRNLQNISITGGATTTGYTIGATAGPAFVLTSGGTILSNGGAAVVNAPLTLANAGAATSGAYTFDASTPGTSRTTVFGGTITGSATAGSTTTLTLQGNSTVVGNALNGIISDGTGGGTLALVKSGAGTWSLGGAVSSFTGGVTLNAGTLRTGSSGNTTTLFGSGPLTFSGGTLNLGSTGATTVNNAVVVTTGTTSSISYRTNDSFNPTAMSGTGTLTFNNGNSALNTVTSSNFQNFSGTIDVQQNATFGTVLRLASAFVQNSLQNATVNVSALSSISNQAGTSGTVTTVLGGLSGAGTIGGSAAGAGTFTYSIGNNNAPTTFSGNIIEGGTHTALTKVGTGTLTLSGTGHTYTGATNINGGTLQLSGANIQTSSLTTVNTGGTLGGAGSLNATHLNPGGVISPGTPITSPLGTLASNSFLDWYGEVTPGIAQMKFDLSVGANTSDAITGLTFFTKGTGSVFAFDFQSTGSAGQTYTLLTFANVADIGNGAFTSADFSYINLAGGVQGTFNLGASALTFTTVVPEPTTWVTVLGGMAALGALTVRRRRTV